MTTAAPDYDRFIKKGDRVSLTNEAGTITGVVVRVTLMNLAVVREDEYGIEAYINRSQLKKLS